MANHNTPSESSSLTSAYPAPKHQGSFDTGSATILRKLNSCNANNGRIGPPPEHLTPTENQIWMDIPDFLSIDGTLPAARIRNKIKNKLSCGAGTVSRVLAWVRREMDRDELQTAYIDRFITNSNSKGQPRKRSVLPSGIFDTATATLIENGTFTLFKHYPDELQLVTVTLPSDSEIAYLACCDLSEEIPFELIKRLLPKEDNPVFVYRWEQQECGRLHLHILIKSKYPPKTAKLKESWFRVMDDFVDERTRCAPFVGEHGRDYRRIGKSWDIRPFTEKENQNGYRWTYLALDEKKGKNVVAGKYLSILNGAWVSPRSHGGLSPALAALVKETEYTLLLPLQDPMQFEIFVSEDLRAGISANWTQWPAIRFIKRSPLGLRYQLGNWTAGWECRIQREDYDAVKQTLAEFDFLTELDADSAAETLRKAPCIMKIRLLPNRWLKAYCYPNPRLGQLVRRMRKSANEEISSRNQKIGEEKKEAEAVPYFGQSNGACRATEPPLVNL